MSYRHLGRNNGLRDDFRWSDQRLDDIDIPWHRTGTPRIPEKKSSKIVCNCSTYTFSENAHKQKNHDQVRYHGSSLKTSDRPIDGTMSRPLHVPKPKPARKYENDRRIKNDVASNGGKNFLDQLYELVLIIKTHVLFISIFMVLWNYLPQLLSFSRHLLISLLKKIPWKVAFSHCLQLFGVQKPKNDKTFSRKKTVIIEKFISNSNNYRQRNDYNNRRGDSVYIKKIFSYFQSSGPARRSNGPEPNWEIFVTSCCFIAATAIFMPNLYLNLFYFLLGLMNTMSS